jgi:haloacetate dehalogenase
MKQSPSLKFFPGFKPLNVTTSTGIAINGVVGGSGPPLLLLHGAPCNVTNWRKVAPTLAEKYTVVATDLRGYGDSDMPDGGENHKNYSKRAMAQDQVDVMTHLGFDRFHVAAHDRGARVAHRMARDHPDKVITLTMMDIIPTLHLYENVDRKFGESYWFWFFYTVPEPVPETFINQSSEFFMNIAFFGRREMIEQEAFDNFLRTMQRKGSAHAQCEDYRAAATIDLEHDRADFNNKLTCPLLVLWGDQNPLNKDVDLLSIWRERAHNVRGHGTPSAHWLPEQIPEQVIEELSSFIEEFR